MLIKSKKRKKIFSTRADVRKHDIYVQSEYLKSNEYFDEQIEAENSEIEHEILIRIPIDKLKAIENNIGTIDGYIVRDSSALDVRPKMLEGFNKRNMRHLNFAVVNKEKLARHNMKLKEVRAALTKLFSVDIGSTMLADVDVRKAISQDFPDDKIFGTKEVFEIDSIRRPGKIDVDPKFNASGLAHLTFNRALKNTKTLTGFHNLEKFQYRDEPVPFKNFKRKFNKMRSNGLDPATIIAKTAYCGQSLQQAAQGQVPDNFKAKKSGQDAEIGDVFHRLVVGSLPSTQLSAGIVRRKKSKRHEAIEVKIKLTEKLLQKLEVGRKPEIVIYARDKNKRRIDFFKKTLDINLLLNRKREAEQALQYADHRLMVQRTINDESLFKLINTSKTNKFFRLSTSKVDISNSYIIQNFEAPGLPVLVPNQSKTMVEGDSIGRDCMIQTRAKVQFSGIAFDNTSFDFIKPKKNMYNEGSVVGIYAETIANGSERPPVRVRVTNIPVDCLAINVVKRNLTKNETRFSPIKNLSAAEELSDASLLTLIEQRPVFTSASSDIDTDLTFLDEDVEIGDAYEYRTELTMDNGERKVSLNSYVLEYEVRTGMIGITSLGLTGESDSYSTTSMTRSNVGYNFEVSLSLSQVDEMFDSLDRNTYDLFSSELDSIRDQIKKIVSCRVELVDVSSGERKHVDDYTVSLDSSGIGRFTAIFNIENPLSQQVLTVTPRISTPTAMVDSVLEKIEILPIMEIKLPISTFGRLKRRRRQLDKLLLPTVGKVLSVQKLGKYNSKSVRFFGLILDPTTKFNNEKEDLFYEGSTGDTISVLVQSNNYLKSDAFKLSYSSFKDMSHKLIHSGRNDKYKKMGILRLNSSKFKPLVEFQALYARSNGTVKFLGMICPFPHVSSTYDFFVDLENETGLVEIFSVAVLRDGRVLDPEKVSNLICTEKSITASRGR